LLNAAVNPNGFSTSVAYCGSLQAAIRGSSPPRRESFPEGEAPRTGFQQQPTIPPGCVFDAELADTDSFSYMDSDGTMFDVAWLDLYNFEDTTLGTSQLFEDLEPFCNI
jgi:hypothetical protein